MTTKEQQCWLRVFGVLIGKLPAEQAARLATEIHQEFRQIYGSHVCCEVDEDVFAATHGVDAPLIVDKYATDGRDWPRVIEDL
jgi:hypothetical protein